MLIERIVSIKINVKTKRDSQILIIQDMLHPRFHPATPLPTLPPCKCLNCTASHLNEHTRSYKLLPWPPRWLLFTLLHLISSYSNTCSFCSSHIRFCSVLWICRAHSCLTAFAISYSFCLKYSSPNLPIDGSCLQLNLSSNVTLSERPWPSTPFYHGESHSVFVSP